MVTKEMELEATVLNELEAECEMQVLLPKDKKAYLFFKRLFDVIFSFLASVILFVPMVIVCLIIYIDSPGASPIYVQERVGKNGKTFKFYKFRSMVPDAEKMLESLLDKNEVDGPAFKIKNDPRITRFGRFIRRASIDELPQLWNVLKGDMSIVGPRPPIGREVALYNDYQKQRLLVTPGITCLWQIKPKRNSLNFNEWLELDLQYIKERNFWLDFKIIIKTIGAVCGLEGV